VGDEWLLTVRLKKIHSTLNPGGFDYEAWAFANGIRAAGYIVAQEKNFLIQPAAYAYGIARIRQAIQEKTSRLLTPSRTSPWILALMIGERNGIPPAEWTVLRNTGTNHLMAIAGLHIGFMSALAYGLASKLWRRIPCLMLRMPAPTVGAFAALLMAIFYSALAGFSIPTQRAVLMLSFVLMTRLQRRIIPLWQAWSIALFFVLLLNPLSVLSSSFWLSFMTLALILYGMSGRLGKQGLWWQWGRPQWVIAVGLLPLSIWLFTQYSLVSFIANTLAIPWVGFLILPFCFLAIIFLFICPPLAKLLLFLADKSLSMLWVLLSGLAQLPGATWQQVLPQYGYIVAATIGVIILLAPAGFPGKYLGFFWLLPLIFFKPASLPDGEARFSLLDVGQGLAAVVQTAHHVLVFDTGPRFGPEQDSGETVVLPFLRSQGIEQVDMLVISHGDNDHRGGAEALLRQLPVLAIRTSVPWFFASWQVDYCLAGTTWLWDGVRFSFLSPTSQQLNQGNNSSCVLRVATQNNAVLLPGDIERNAEKWLVQQGALLAADIIVAPHHGSKTSGLREFIAAVHPQYVLYAIGYRNRYHFPQESVMQTYREGGVVSYDTVSAGAIQFLLGKKTLLPPQVYRQQFRHYWRD
jgi:competence protein ComEC